MSGNFFGYHGLELEKEREISKLAKRVVSISLTLENLSKCDSQCSNIFTFAESCTGGLLASWAASIPGVSSVFPGSAVTYSDRSKIEQLSVSPETIERHGAVSAQCAAEMAWGVLKLFNTMLAVSVTGIAGPGGGSEEKPVGTVWFALAYSDGRMKLKRGIYRRGPRRIVQLCAVRSAFDLLLAGLDEV